MIIIIITYQLLTTFADLLKTVSTDRLKVNAVVGASKHLTLVIDLDGRDDALSADKIVMSPSNSVSLVSGVAIQNGGGWRRC